MTQFLLHLKSDPQPQCLLDWCHLATPSVTHSNMLSFEGWHKGLHFGCAAAIISAIVRGLQCLVPPMLFLWRPDPRAKWDAYLGLTASRQRKKRKKKKILEQFGPENNRILYFLAEKWMNLSSKCEAGIKSKDNKWWAQHSSNSLGLSLWDFSSNSPTGLQRDMWVSFSLLCMDSGTVSDVI